MLSTFAGLIAHATFWALLLCGWWLGELRARGTIVFVTLWIAGYAYAQVNSRAGDFFAPCVAILAIGLMFKIFKGDMSL